MWARRVARKVLAPVRIVANFAMLPLRLLALPMRVLIQPKTVGENFMKLILAFGLGGYASLRFCEKVCRPSDEQKLLALAAMRQQLERALFLAPLATMLRLKMLIVDPVSASIVANQATFLAIARNAQLSISLGVGALLGTALRLQGKLNGWLMSRIATVSP